MNKQQLHKSIEELRAELEKVDEAEDHVRERIQALLKEIDGLADESGEIPPQRHEQFLDRLKESIQHFEVSHISLTDAVSRVINALTGIGI